MMRRYCCIKAEVPGASGEGFRFLVSPLEVAGFRCSISIISPCGEDVAGGAHTLQADLGKIAAMARANDVRRALDEITVSHRERLVAELRADPKLALEYLRAAAEDGDAHVFLIALKTVAPR